VRRLVSVRAQHWGVTATPDGTAKLTEGLSGPVEGQKVLVVDDITDTGESLSLATAHVAEQHPARLETAAFLHIAHSKFVPTYYAEEIPRTGWVWVVFPWNYWEDLAALATKAAEFGRGVSTIRETLRTRSGLDVPLADLERVADLVPIR
jgi:hypoxanthine phosphoribosyltransferase